MNTKLLVSVLVVVVTGGGLWYYMQGGALPITQQTDTRFGADGDEGGSVKPNTSLIAGESMMGTWQSTEDPRFVREFKDFSETELAGSVVDYYNGEKVAHGTYTVATDGDYVAVILLMQGSQQETLNFHLNKLTPEVLEMTYMDRGGVLSFSRVQ